MRDFKTVDRVVGWAVFAVATISYLLTIEPTASYWDCGEFICTAFRQEVGHPPGAPLFMILGRFFSLFAFGDVEKVSVMINSMSAIASGLTILFLYWSISHIARRIVCGVQGADAASIAQRISIIGSGVVGSLAYAYTDTFWFSAVEGEVYAMSSLFTAVVFWCILKWEDEASQKYSNRWLVLICYLMGLSIGVHLLNLLVIPAIVFVYYFKKYETTGLGIIKAFLVSCLILAGVLYGIIPGVVWLASRFELMFTNGMGLPYNTGTIIYVVLGVGALVYGLYYSARNGKVVINTILLCVSVIIIGYSSFAMIVIRSAANPPMDENNPDNVFALQGYLNREQYGDRPLLRGEYFNSVIERYEDGSPTYIQRNGRYEIVDHKPVHIYEPGSTTFFPRMYSPDPMHVRGYQYWAGLENTAAKPTFGQNLAFFFRYQINYMYLRYLWWNFIGRQNDIQGHDNSPIHGNWISGIPSIDNARLGDQGLLSDALQNNKGNNKYYFLPLILAIFGVLYMLMSGKDGRQYCWVVFLFFFMTGIAIVVYLNQTPYQPRERDYAYAGSFYAFAMYVGFGMAFLCRVAEKYVGRSVASASVALMLSIVCGPLILAIQNWDDHDRSGRYTARDFGKNYLESCAPNAILFTNGDNDTFPLWYAQEVEGIRTDVRVVNLAYLNTHWYINQMRRKAYLSNPLPISISSDKLVEGSRDVVYHNEVPNMFFAQKYETNLPKYAQRVDAVHGKLLELLGNSGFQKALPGDYDAVVNKLQLKDQPVQMARFINGLAQQPEKLGVDRGSISTLKNDMDLLVAEICREPVPLDAIVDLIADDSENSKAVMDNGEKVDFVPTLNYMLPVDKARVIASGTVAGADTARIVDRLVWKHPRGYIRKAELMVLDILAHNNWERPVYFAITVGNEAYQGLDKYFRLDGLAYRLVPVETKPANGERGYVDPDIMYSAYCQKFAWGGIDNPGVYLDENNLRMLMNVKNGFCRLAGAYVDRGNNDKAVEVADRCYKVMPRNLVAPSYYDVEMARIYYRTGCSDKARSVMDALGEQIFQDLRYFTSLGGDMAELVQTDFDRSAALAHEVVRQLRENGDADYARRYALKFADILRNVPLLTNVTAGTVDSKSFYDMYMRMSDSQKQLVQIFMFLLDESI
ncbi:MAG: DUF2723 domain-containing protein [Bacteroidales bacterium]|nr:DUF2723 domain-containing protein [Bacteroidales bacterium]